MEGSGLLITLVSAFIAVVMLLAQLKLFTIASTLEKILAELQKQNVQPTGHTTQPNTVAAATAAAAAADPQTPRTLMDRLSGKL